MNYFLFRNLVIPMLFVSFFFTAPGQVSQSNSDWNQWRGPDRTGRWYHGPTLDTLHGEQITQLWETAVGPGYSGPTISEGKVYVMDYINGNERVHCFNAEDGSEVWTYTYPASYNVGYPTGPRASVLISNQKAYSVGTMGHIHCFNASSGKVLWQIDGLKQFQISMPIWGLAASPILVKDKLIVQLGGASGACLVALHKDTGKEIWRALDEEASYSAPILISQAGKEVLVCWTGESISGLSPDDGTIYWSVPFQPGQMIINISDPVYDSPYLFLSGFYDGSYLLELDQVSTNAELVYFRKGKSEKETDALHCCISTPVIQEKYIYGVDSYGETRCLDLLTGDRIWEDLTLVPKARWANVHLVRQEDRVWGFNELGELLLGKFTPSGYRDMGRVKVIDPIKVSPNPRGGVCWAHPAFSGKRIFLRNDAKLVCVKVNNL